MSERADTTLGNDEWCLAGGGEMGALLRAKDWARTPLGPVAAWPTSLKTMVGVVLANRFPMLLWWGPEMLQVYNDAYRPVLGGKHPESVAMPAAQAWSEIWPVIGPMARGVLAGGPATWSEDMLLFINSRGFVEETFHTFSYSPVRDDEGRVGGVLVTVRETTEQVQGGRQMRMLAQLSARSAEADSAEEACRIAAEILGSNDADYPFALLYLLDREGSEARLVSRSGFGSDHPPRGPYRVPLQGADGAPAAWPFLEALRTGREVLVDDPEARVGPLPPGRYGAPPERAVVLPLVRPGQPAPYGFLVAGVNARRALDERYLRLLRLTADRVVMAIANARAYEEERARAEKLEEIDRAKTAFFSNVSHEFRTPLTLLLGPTEDALAGEEKSLSGEELVMVHRNALRLLRLVNALLDFSRIEAGRARATFEPVNLTRFTTELASGFRSTMERGGLRYVTELEPLPEPVFVDRELWEKVVLNLLSNAFKFTFDGAVSVTLRAEGKRARLVVRDTGTGIPEAEVPHLFERFHRVQGARSRSFEGTGIGLALVHELVHLHGGTISVESVAGQGSTFTVSLPFGRAHLPADRVRETSSVDETPARGIAPYVEEAERWLPPRDGGTDGGARGAGFSERARDAERALERASAGLPRARVLLADDNADMRDYVQRLLRPHFDVRAVADGAEALAVLREGGPPPDMVLTDAMMPGLDGFALLRALRADERTRGIPVVMLSARAGEEARVEGIEAGADDYLSKPFSARELLARVRTHLSLARARADALAQGERLRELFMKSPVAVSVLRGPEHRYELVSPRAHRLTGYRDVLGRTIREVFPKVPEALVRVLDDTYRTGAVTEAREWETVLDWSGGGRETSKFFDVTWAPLRSASGEIEGVVSFAVEVTEQVLARRRLEEAHRAVENANRAKDEFLATMSHELRTPLNAMLGWTRMLRTGSLPEDKRERALETIERNARAQVTLIEDILDISRIISGKLRLNIESVPVHAVVDAALDTVRPAADAKGVKLSAQLAPDAGAVMGDASRLQQVAWNLLSNAVKFTPRGGHVRVTLAREPSFVELTVADTGQGIEPDFLPHLFERFRQADGSMTRAHGGLGLGLSIGKHLIELHGGTIAGKSDGPGRGATFTVRIPVEAPERVSTEPPAAATHVPAPEQARAEGTGVAGLRLVVVDDEPDARELVQAMLELCGATVKSAPNAAEAFALVTGWRPDALVSDIGMPGEDGYSLIRRVRALTAEQGGRTPAVALTAYTRIEDRTRALASGFDHHVTKPVDAAELLAVLSRVTDRGR